MKLIRARVQNYRSVEDSGEFEIGDLTCLVGKNEAGKTAVISALRGLRPTQPFEFDETIDYPRRFSTRFDDRHPDGTAEVVRTWWRLDEADKAAVEKRFGPGVLVGDIFQAHLGFRYENGPVWEIEVNHAKCLEHLVGKHSLDETERNALHGVQDGAGADRTLSGLAEPSPKQEALLAEIKKSRESNFTLGVIDILAARQPTFFFTSHFERMSGMISIAQLQQDKQKRNVSSGDRIFLDFLEYAGTTLEELLEADRREALKAKCEAASNEITEEIFQFWSQNNALEVVIEIDAGKPADKAPFNAGMVADIRIKNTNHKATLPLSERSAGFVWFFSFIAQFKQLKKSNGNAIILLDEPGLTLHGKAQGDLLRYIFERLLPDHQVIFTTHSPFMVPMDRLADVRIVEDVIIESKGKRAEVKGTKVTSDVLAVGDDTLFPLQGALGYEVTQSLFIGANTWLVEGPSDILYLKVLSQALIKRGREGMNGKWNLCPAGGIDKLAPFVRLFGGNNLNVAVLSDIANGDKTKIENLKKADILKAGHFYTCADFVDQIEADVEDLFDADLFVEILNAAYKPPAAHVVTRESLMDAAATPRIVKKAEALFKLMPPEVANFDHYAPSRWLLEHPAILDGDNFAVQTTLDRAQRLFETFNKLLG
ncbi:AAA family ATPase [Janthinobacterium lividum]|uniref:AAA family ATPase n=1 Tax=Janthinobacterium lividum TaxID=29581 RepID=A0ABU0XNC5_9BURK|nr:AAA family ATPase [Janthinobacterium lividum]MDQ4625021.1 AAA family ATPase [Janthinobacterium lividum]MDQ4673376.1 AAA family ATPase [Janthinobacterium lividum]MDQ4684106.1 AAA family ATPase [Janthinobacterium lividum]